MNKIILNKDSVIYVLCPAYFKTGGTELLHQYVYVAKKNGLKATIVYPNATNEKNINPAFLCYINEYKNLPDILDEKQNVLIVPEIYTNYLKKYKMIKKVIWWESVDNYCKLVSYKFALKLGLYKQILYIFKNKHKMLLPKQLKSIDYHFVQSEYARDYIEQKKCNNIFYVSDYINEIYLNSQIDLSMKEDIVCYNPKKGYDFTRRIISSSTTKIRFIPIENMTNDEVRDLLKRSKVYIDFGNHPGKDRFPREAAMMKCCIITGKNGSAKYYEDVAIPDEYKFDNKKSNIKAIKLKIVECINNYNSKINDFNYYVDKTIKEKEQFENNVIDCYELENE